MPKAVETKKVHFFDGLLGRPFLHGHAIGRDEDAGAVFAKAAMDEDSISVFTKQ